MKSFTINRDKFWPLVTFALLLAAAAFQLRHQGRIWWCSCGQLFLWDSDIWSRHNSQHLLDPYSFSHVLHGLIFCGLASLAFPRLKLIWRLWIAVLIEVLWELLENSPLIIDRYRSVTISLGYEGDSIINSLADIACCALGFAIALRLGLLRSIAFYVVTELILLFWVRDNLTLNIIMLLCPIEAIKNWQLPH